MGRCGGHTRTGVVDFLAQPRFHVGFTVFEQWIFIVKTVIGRTKKVKFRFYNKLAVFFVWHSTTLLSNACKSFLFLGMIAAQYEIHRNLVSEQ